MALKVEALERMLQGFWLAVHPVSVVVDDHNAMLACQMDQPD